MTLLPTPDIMTITIESVRQFTSHSVETAGSSYTRHGPDSWTVTMGESEEQVYDCADLEAAFQEFMRKESTFIHA